MEALRQNWRAKIGCLILATVVYYLIKNEIVDPRVQIQDLTLPPQPVREF